MAPRPSTPELEATRLQGLLDYERGFWSRGLLVAGVDEAGRGPLAGPIVAAAVILPAGRSIAGADDSKLLAAAVREALFDEILATALCVGVGAASVREIDRVNILQATTRAMGRALARLSRSPDQVVVDGNPVKGLAWAHEAVVDGDALIHSISCASIVAKVVRDRLMHRLARRYPRYGWETNVGYGTPAHRSAIDALGLTPHHRLSFGGLQLDLGL
jgi:ribonuclease HII